MNNLNKNTCLIKRLLPPVVYLFFLAALWFITPISQFVSPPHADSAESAAKLCEEKFTYISAALSGLHFTGYTRTLAGHTNGYYYYTFEEDRCILLLLSPDTCGNGAPLLDRAAVRVQRITDFNDYEALTENLAHDLNWTASGIQNRIPDYVLSEPAVKSPLTILLVGVYFLSGIYALADFCKILYRFLL